MNKWDWGLKNYSSHNISLFRLCPGGRFFPRFYWRRKAPPTYLPFAQPLVSGRTTTPTRTVSAPYKVTILPGPAEAYYSSQKALLPLLGVIAPFPVRDTVEASEGARPGVVRALPGSRVEAVT